MLWGALAPGQDVIFLDPRNTSYKLCEHSVLRREASSLFNYKTREDASYTELCWGNMEPFKSGIVGQLCKHMLVVFSVSQSEGKRPSLPSGRMT